MSLAYAISDSSTMVRRSMKHMLRNPSTFFAAVVFPVILLLVFTNILGGAFTPGGAYINYITPGMLILAIGYGTSMTAVSVSTDMAQGVINRFRTMAISRASVLTGHVMGSVVRTMLGAAVLIAVSLVSGFDPSASFAGWLAATGMILLLVVAMTWLTAAFGLAAKSPEGASFGAFPLIFLPYTSSAFAPTDTMPGPVRWFAENQPMTPAIETIRGLLVGGPIGSSGLLAILWWTGIGLIGYAWSKRLFARDPR